MDELYEKTEALLKSLLSIKTGASKDLMVPAIKPPSMKIPKPSIKQPSAAKIPSGLPPPSKKDPVKVAEQLKNPNPKKVNVEILKVEKNGQWALEKGVTLEDRQKRKNTPRWEQPREKAEPHIASSLPSHVPGNKEVRTGPVPANDNVEVDKSEISFTHQHHDLGGDGDLTHVKAIHPVHGVVGEAMFEHQPDNSIRLENIDVHPNHQRMGIGTQMVNHAVSVTGKKMLSSTGRTAAGEALWNKVKPQLGKSEVPEPKFKVGDRVDLSNEPGHILEVLHSKWNPQAELHQYRLKVHSHPEGKRYGCGHEGQECGASTNKPESILMHKK